jgi:hypothetical protein
MDLSYTRLVARMNVQHKENLPMMTNRTFKQHTTERRPRVVGTVMCVLPTSINNRQYRH